MTISIIIPTHNSERTLERALQSINIQNVNCNIEILLCDDHSKNLSFLLDMCDKYHCKLLRVTNGTGGPNFGRNLGIKNAIGDFIAFLDHDDVWIEGKLANQLKQLNNGADFVYSSSITRKE